MSPNEALDTPDAQPILTQEVDVIEAPPKRKRTLEGEEGFHRRSPRVIVPVYVSNEEEARALAITKTNARQFNGIDYVSFPSPIHIQMGSCICTSSANKFDKMLVACPQGPLLKEVEAVVEAVAAPVTGPEYTYVPIQQPDEMVFRFKWNPRGNKASMFIREDASQKIPVAGDAGPLVLEVSGFYFNKSTKTSGATARVVSFKKE